MSTDLQVVRSAPVQGPQAAVRSATLTRRTGLWLSALLLGTLLKGVVWAFFLWPLDAPDEPSHFNHVMQIHTNHALPAVYMAAPDFMRTPPSTPQDPDTRAFLEHYGFNAFRAMPYESSQPPLYYLTAALFVAPLSEDRLTLMYAARIISVLFGVGSVLALWWGVRVLWPDIPFMQWIAPLVLTLSPQFTFVTSTVTNDAAVLCFGALLFAVWAAGMRSTSTSEKVSIWRWALLAGIVTALGLISKLTMAVTIPATLLWLWWLSQGHEVTVAHHWRRFVAGALVSAVVIVAGVGWWVARNLSLYGEPTGSGSVFNIYHKIYWTRLGFPLKQLYSFFPLTPFDDSRGGFVVRTFTSSWANFGWTTVSIPWIAYAGMALLSMVGLVGLARVWRAGLAKPLPALSLQRRRVGWLLVIAALGAFIMLLAYNGLVDYQPQGRYFFVELGPLLLLLVVGLRRATSRPAINNALVWALLGMLVVLQILSVLTLLDHNANLASQA
jgi:4-amino-4-deoxy-L-arabinose transferase-like glycosyltransferase